MTTSVTVNACVSDDKEVHVLIVENGEKVESDKLQNGESKDYVVYDGRAINVREEMKSNPTDV